MPTNVISTKAAGRTERSVFHSNSRIKGSAIGTAFVVKRGQTAGDAIDSGTESRGKSPDSAPTSRSIEKAFSIARHELEELSKQPGNGEIFSAHLEMLNDPLIDEAIEGAESEGFEGMEACRRACESICAMFAEIDDEYLRSRTDDVRDVFARIIRILSGKLDTNPFAGMPEGCIVIADELAPSDTALMDLSRVAGFVTERGSSTSHVCIIAASHGIAAAVGVKGCTGIAADSTVIIDGKRNCVIAEPDETETAAFRDSLVEDEEDIKSSSDRTVYANTGSTDDIRRAIEAGADGIGLLRTEFLYMQSQDFPSEEEQYRVYKETAELCGDRVLTIRTLDIGADKKLPYFALPAEENPFLGIRGIRLSLRMKEVFKTQLRAIMRAAAHGNIRVMFPMVSSLYELEAARKVLAECAAELEKEKIEHKENVATGVMIETPAAVFIADELAEAADFFSIGTNDLTQYIMAADRGNSECAAYCDYNSPAVLKAIRATIDAAHRHGIECCMCGEMAGDSSMTATLKEMGLDSFSVAIPLISTIRRA